MEVHLDPELQARLGRLAAERGSDASALAREAIERLVDYEAWFVREVEKGIAAAERGEILTHEEVGERLARFLDKQQSRA